METYLNFHKSDAANKSQKKVIKAKLFNELNENFNTTVKSKILPILSETHRSKIKFNFNDFLNNNNIFTRILDPTKDPLRTNATNYSKYQRTQTTSDIEDYSNPIKSLKKLKANKQIHDNIINLISLKQIKCYMEKYEKVIMEKIKK